MNLFAGAHPVAGFPILNQMPWTTGAVERSLRDSELLLTGVDLPKAMAAWLRSQSEEGLTRIAMRSLERSTHVKWFLGEWPGAYTVWLHEYKRPAEFARAVDFAASVHNHRYAFCSRVLSGALHVSDFSVAAQGDSIRRVGTRTINRGQTMMLSHEDIHRVDRVDPHTCTLLVQGPPARNFSTCYETASGRGRRVYDLHSRLPHTIDFLAKNAVTGFPVH